MLTWAIIFFLISVVAGIFGFTGIAVGAQAVARVLLTEVSSDAGGVVILSPPVVSARVFFCSSCPIERNALRPNRRHGTLGMA